MKTVADHVGVSRQLVSMIVRGLPGASEETRRKVLDAAEELGYYPDASARALRGRRSYRLGVLFTMHEPFEVDLVEALLESARSRGFSLVLGPLTGHRDQANVITELLSQRIEALFVLAADGGAACIRNLPRKVPVVLIGGPRSEEVLDDLRVDDAEGVQLLVSHLIDLGHTSISHVSGGTGPSASVRIESYRKAMAKAGLESNVDILDGAYTEEAGSHAAFELLERKNLPTAVMGANDRNAMGVLGTFVREGLRVPEDISVVGFDNSSIAGLPYVQLTTVGFVPRDLATRAVEAVIRRLDDPSASRLQHREQPRLTVRSSSGCPRLTP